MSEDIVGGALLPNQRTTKVWDDYLACAYAEGFAEGEDASNEEKLEAWSYLIVTGKCWSLQGQYGRTATALIEQGLIDEDGFINWNELDNLINEVL